MLNKNKVGKPYSFSNMLIMAVFAAKCVFKIWYREFTGSIEEFIDSIKEGIHLDVRTH